jgi:hypothetical protein
MSLNQEELRIQLVSALHIVPGARELVEFGSKRDGRNDRFSDLDFQLLVDDCATALPAFLTILGDIVSPEIEWTISDDPNHYWLMAIPDCTKPWLKVDIGLDPYNDGRPEYLGWTGEAIWTQAPPKTPLSSIEDPTWSRPAPGSIENFVVWSLIDFARIAKFKGRGKPLNMLKVISQFTKAVVIVEATRSGRHHDFSDMPATKMIAELDQSSIVDAVDVNLPLGDIISRLAYRLCDAVGDDDQLRTSCERMVSASATGLRSPD